MGPYADYPSLKGRHVFITGGATGIGAALVEAFAGQGAVVTFVDVARAAGVALSTRLGARVTFEACDVTRPEALEAVLVHLKHCDILQPRATTANAPIATHDSQVPPNPVYFSPSACRLRPGIAARARRL